MSDEYWFARRLLKWHRSHNRSLYWRKTRNRYIKLICEILVKRTGAEVVDRFAGSFFDKYRDITSLASVSEEELSDDLKPLGLYRQRAGHLIKAANIIQRDFKGRIPKNRDTLLSIPGLGEYTVNAFLCFSYGEPLPIIDTNVARIITRFFNTPISRSEARRCPNIYETASKIILTHPENTKKLNYGLLDFGALMCKSRNPQCECCPISVKCIWYNNRNPAIGHRIKSMIN